MNKMVPGCEHYERYCEFNAIIDPSRYFRIGTRSNKKEFEYLTHIIDKHSFDDYCTHEHPSLNYNIGKGEKLKYLGITFAYMTVRFETDRCQVSPSDVIGNVFIHTIKQRSIVIDVESLRATMYERTTYIDKFGNTWKLLNDDGDVELIELASDDFMITYYISKPTVDYLNEFSYEDYDFWKRTSGQFKMC